MATIAIIPARGGSTRVPLKNIRDFHGIPMLGRTIQTLIRAEIFQRIIVSTDNDQIASIAEEFGAEVPFVRSASLSQNETPTVKVIADAIRKLDLNENEQVACVYATNPFLRVDALQFGLKLLLQSAQINYVSTVTSFPFPIQRSLSINELGLLEMSDPSFMMKHSQDLEPRFHECAQFWWALASTWEAELGMQTQMKGIYLPRWMTQDIDTFEDWDSAEIKFSILQENSKFTDYRISDENIVTLNFSS